MGAGWGSSRVQTPRGPAGLLFPPPLHCLRGNPWRGRCQKSPFRGPLKTGSSLAKLCRHAPVLTRPTQGRTNAKHPFGESSFKITFISSGPLALPSCLPSPAGSERTCWTDTASRSARRRGAARPGPPGGGSGRKWERAPSSRRRRARLAGQRCPGRRLRPQTPPRSAGPSPGTSAPPQAAQAAHCSGARGQGRRARSRSSRSPRPESAPALLTCWAAAGAGAAPARPQPPRGAAAPAPGPPRAQASRAPPRAGVLPGPHSQGAPQFPGNRRLHVRHGREHARSAAHRCPRRVRGARGRRRCGGSGRLSAPEAPGSAGPDAAPLSRAECGARRPQPRPARPRPRPEPPRASRFQARPSGAPPLRSWLGSDPSADPASRSELLPF